MRVGLLRLFDGEARAVVVEGLVELRLRRVDVPDVLLRPSADLFLATFRRMPTASAEGCDDVVRAVASGRASGARHVNRVPFKIVTGVE